MSLFRIVKYSSLLFFLGKYKSKLFKVIGVLLFAAITSLLYTDVSQYLQLQHPGIVIYALAAKILIVYGSLAFVLWQFRPEPEPQGKANSAIREPAAKNETPNSEADKTLANSPLSALEDVTHTDHLRSRYDGVLRGEHEDTD
ncbi:MAG: hypothetical protein V7709_02035 [Halioglobus sp.]